MKRYQRSLAIAAAVLLAGCAAVAPRTQSYVPAPPPALAPHQDNGAIYQAGRSMPLFEDLKARRIGDSLTVVLMESTNASNKASTATKKQDQIGIDNPTLFGRPVTSGGVGILGASVNSNQAFNGQGNSSQSNSLSGSVTVTVAQVLPNGNLVVRGEKQITLNQNAQTVELSGIVRPVDISPSNTVLSTQVADARIIYSGGGPVGDASAMGWLARFFMSTLWPF